MPGCRSDGPDCNDGAHTNVLPGRLLKGERGNVYGFCAASGEHGTAGTLRTRRGTGAAVDLRAARSRRPVALRSWPDVAAVHVVRLRVARVGGQGSVGAAV